MRWTLLAAGAGVCLIAGALGALSIRQAWVGAKIAALTAPPFRSFASENAALSPKGDRPRVVLIGDSRIEQWPSDLLDGRWQFVNRGVGGETVAQVAQRFEGDALNLAPDFVVIAAGANDIVAADYLDPAARRAALDRTVTMPIDLARRARAQGASVLIATIPPPSRPDLPRLLVWKEGLRDLFLEANARLRRESAEAGVPIVDFAAALDSGDRRTPDRYRRDTMHLNEAGYRKLSEALDRALERPRAP